MSTLSPTDNTKTTEVFSSVEKRKRAFDAAKHYFEVHKNDTPPITKFAKNNTTENKTGHSFIKFGDLVYCVTEKLGQGSFGRVKTVMNESGQQYAVKIEYQSSTPTPVQVIARADELEVMGALSVPYLLGEMTRIGVSQKSKEDYIKRYMLIPLESGINLEKWLENPTTLTPDEYKIQKSSLL